MVREGDRFVINKIGAPVKVAAPAIKTIDCDYIVILTERAMQNVTDGNYNSAITKSRTLLQEVF